MAVSPPPGLDETFRGKFAKKDIDSVLEGIWSEDSGYQNEELVQLEQKLYRVKRKVYAIQRVLTQNIESSIILLGILHDAIDEL